MATTRWKDYSLKGETSVPVAPTQHSFERTVPVAQEWFTPQIDRKALKLLMKRSDGPALRQFSLWLALLVAFGAGAFAMWGTAWCVPLFAIYGVLYSAADHRHHELSHGTPFKTRWVNEFFFHLCAFMTLREGYYYRWSHTRHHTHTLVVGKDPEIAVPRPPALLEIASDLFFIKDGLTQVSRLFRNASGDLTEDGKHFVPGPEVSKVVWASRLYLFAFTAVIGTCWWADSLVPALFVVLPRFYGGALSQIFNLTQHAGMAEDLRDHRASTRTVYLNPVFQFLYFNMNYHLEHHMFPMVPFHQLRVLHKMIADQCPPAYKGLREVYREIIPALIRQRSDPSWFVRRELPQAALRT